MKLNELAKIVYSNTELSVVRYTDNDNLIYLYEGLPQSIPEQLLDRKVTSISINQILDNTLDIYLA